MTPARTLPLALALVAGAATVFAFAPFGGAALPLITLGLLILLWQGAATARGPRRRSASRSVSGLFGAGASWVFIALHTFGGMPWPLAGIGTAGFCAFLALYPAAVGWLAVRWTAQGSGPRALAAAGAWTVAEWARSIIFTGFPWLSLGYAALPGGPPTPLAGYAPLGGVFLVSLVTALAAAAARAGDRCARASPHGRAPQRSSARQSSSSPAARPCRRIEWTSAAGTPVAMSLVQGNVAQDLKFDPDFRARTFDLYTDLVAASRGRLVVLPESAFPVFADEVPDAVLLRIIGTVVPRDGDAIIGMFTSEPPLAPGDGPRYYNSVVSVGTAPPQLYRKRHLVPFGETIPLEPVVGWFIRRVLAIPLASQARGDPDPPPLRLAGEQLAVNICYEDAFGADIRRQAREATLLVNVTNDAWYGRSLAAEQHNQIAAMRALESGRPLLRATNTGITSAIGHDGREIARLPWFTRGILEVEIAGRQGATPYVRWGDAPAGRDRIGACSSQRSRCAVATESRPPDAAALRSPGRCR